MKEALRLRMAVLALMGVAAANSYGIVLTSGGSTINLVDAGVDAGMASGWNVNNGPYNLFREEYFYRLENGGAVSGLGALGNVSGIQLLPNVAKFSYGFQGGIMAEVLYMFVGGTNQSDLAETVSIRNTGRTSAHFELFEYDDFDLGGVLLNDGKWNNMNSIGQTNNHGTSVEVVTAPPADFTEVNDWAVLLSEMGSATFGNLDSAKKTYTGDAAFAFQWNINLEPGQAFIMSKDKLLIVPEPGTLAAFGGLVAIALRRRIKK